MTILEAAGPGCYRWRTELAAAGLNDCGSGLRWMADNKEDLGVSHIVVSGESGGGNLTLATVLKAKADGNLGLVAGA